MASTQLAIRLSDDVNSNDYNSTRKAIDNIVDLCDASTASSYKADLNRLEKLLSCTFAAIDDRIRRVNHVAQDALAIATSVGPNVTYRIVAPADIRTAVIQNTAPSVAVKGTGDVRWRSTVGIPGAVVITGLGFTPTSAIINTSETSAITIQYGFLEGTNSYIINCSITPKDTWKINLSTLTCLEDFVKPNYGTHGLFYPTDTNNTHNWDMADLRMAHVDVTFDDQSIVIRGEPFAVDALVSLIKTYGLTCVAAASSKAVNTPSFCTYVPGATTVTTEETRIPSGPSATGEVLAVAREANGTTYSTLDMILNVFKVVVATSSQIIRIPAVASVVDTGIAWAATLLSDFGLLDAIIEFGSFLAPLIAFV